MTTEDAPEHFSWEEIYALYRVGWKEEGAEIGYVYDLHDDPSSLGERGSGPSPLINPIEAFGN